MPEIQTRRTVGQRKPFTISDGRSSKIPVRGRRVQVGGACVTCTLRLITAKTTRIRQGGNGLSARSGR
jgi:hypothetical protein